MTTETGTTPAPGSISPGRAACEAFWAAIEAGPSIQEPGAAWNWAVSQKATGAWEAAAKAAAAAGRDDDELARLRNACKHMGSVIVSMSRQMECARIEMLKNGPERAMQWILNGLPDVDDNPPGMRWDGKESADEWFERTADYARSEAAK